MKSVRHSLLCALLVAAATPAFAADSSQWAIDIRAATRLISATPAKGASTLQAGVEFRMDPGWHTYWRYPGDSGVPPRFDFDASENLGSAKVLYPAPHAFTDESGTSIGYLEHVIFPVEVTPRDPNKPVHLKLTVNYAVCQKLCVPAEANLELIVGDKSDFDQRLGKAEAAVPKVVSPQQAGLTLHRVNSDAKPAVEVQVAGANKDTQIFVEGPTLEWALPIPKPVSGAEGRYSFALDGLPPGTDPKAPVDLTFTVVNGDKAIETKTHLD
ncbi:MAG TPA: protein-disulfide reductase DsbD domain-containing protein [Pseudolabrys sp.]|jgi:DsbC/DsbD-like thiol-disulfide interchange protein|nr:protein-disulfide reductase DsbD domain-containing protein [Pseudolabrys sp.]